MAAGAVAVVDDGTQRPFFFFWKHADHIPQHKWCRYLPGGAKEKKKYRHSGVFELKRSVLCVHLIVFSFSSLSTAFNIASSFSTAFIIASSLSTAFIISSSLSTAPPPTHTHTWHNSQKSSLKFIRPCPLPSFLIVLIFLKNHYALNYIKLWENCGC